MTDINKIKENFINNQLLVYKNFDYKIVDAFLKIDYEAFLPDEFKHLAYLDKRIKIKEGRFLLNRLEFALMVDVLELKNTDFVLNVGASYGYSAAILSCLCNAVLALENDADVFKEAEENIIKNQIDNVALFKSAGNKGFLEQAPYDAILLIDDINIEIDDSILSQLSEKGRLVGFHREGKILRVFLIKKENGNFKKDYIFNFVQ